MIFYTVIEGKNLAAKDINGIILLLIFIVFDQIIILYLPQPGLSDPYCVITVTGAKAGNKVRTKTVFKSLSPVWGEKYEL